MNATTAFAGPKAAARAAALWYAQHSIDFALAPGSVPGLPSTWPDALRARFEAETGAAPAETPAPSTPTPRPSTAPASSPRTAPASTPTAPAAHAAGLIADAMAQLMAASVAPLDADAVETIARRVASEIAASTLADARRTVLEVPRIDGTRAQIDNPHPALARVLNWIGAGEPVWLVGPAGSGKTTIGAHVADALGLDFFPVSCSAGMSEASLLGFVDPSNGAFLPGPLLRAFENGGLVLLDEIDAADANVLVAVNSALSNGHLGVPKRHAAPVARRHENFRLIAAANTYGSGATRQYVGRNQLDAATLNRFAQIPIDYAPNILAAACPDETIRRQLDAVRARIDAANAASASTGSAPAFRRILSPRDYRRAAIAAQLGEDWREIVFAGWSEQEIRSVEAGK